MARQCPQCGRSFADEVTFCTSDGSTLVEAVELPNPANAMPTASGGPETSPQVILQGTPTSPAVPAELMPTQVDLITGTQVGEYVVEEQIGEGGMGVIFSARHPLIGKRVAIKVLNPEMASNVSIVQRFIQEARSVNQIGHRNIVDIFSFGRLPDGRHYFVMEHLDGVPFSRRIVEPMDWREGVDIWLQMASAIEAAHSNGIIHRDLKPDNVFVCKSGDGPFVKVLDFGIAKLLGDQSVQKTGTGVPMGTPLYMSPEQTRGTQVDHRTDLYAFGCILYETIVGDTPFNAPSFYEVMTKQLTEPPPPFVGRAMVNPALEALVFALLQKDPENRPPSMSEVRKELIRLRDIALREDQPLFERAGGMGRAVPKAGPEEPTAQWKAHAEAGYTVPDPRDSGEMRALSGLAASADRGRSGSKTPLIAGLGAAILATGGVIAWQATRSAPPPPPAPVVAAPTLPKPTGGQIKVISTESGVTMFLDGKQVAEGGPVLQVPATPGRHEIKVTRPGFLPYSTGVMVAAGLTTDEVIKLEPEKAAPTPAPAPSKPHRPSKPTGPAVNPGVVPRHKDSTLNPFGG